MKIQKAAACVLVLANFIVAPGFAYPDLTRAKLQRMYLDFLAAKNIEAEIDGNGDIQFMHKLQNYECRYRIRVDPGDPVFFQLLTADLWRLESEKELAAAFFAASRVNRDVWQAKAFVNSQSDDVVFTAQTLLAKPEDFVNIFDKLVECLDEGFWTFAGAMRD
ncbi:MAG: YbjN domain-containing protein [Spirochaetaceae bacterium]|nr:YbjN domain-containing protein [Spirochaetaceae bacterium]